MKMKYTIALFIALIIIWGTNWPIAKIGLSHTTPTNFIELRFISATLAMFLITLLSKNFVIPRIKDLPVILVVSFFQMGLLLWLSNYGLSLVDPGKASFLIYTTSVWIIPLSTFFGQKMAWKEWVSFGMGLIGVLFLIHPWQAGWNKNIAKGDLALLLSSFSWAIGILFARHMKWHRSPAQLLPWQLLFSALCTVGFGYYQGVGLMPSRMSAPLLWALFYTGPIATAVAYWAMLYVSIHLRPSVTSFGLVWVPVISLISSYLFLDEPVTYTISIAMVLIIGGILLHIYSEKKRENQKQFFKEVP